MRKPSKVWICPTCGNRFMAGETIVNGRPGRTCENGHHHSYYDYQRFDQGKPLSTFKSRPTKQNSGNKAAHINLVSPSVTKEPPRGNERDWHLAMLWVGAYDKLMSQLPEGSMARSMVEGALGKAYSASQMVIDGRQKAELRKAA